MRPDWIWKNSVDSVGVVTLRLFSRPGRLKHVSVRTHKFRLNQANFRPQHEAHEEHEEHSVGTQIGGPQTKINWIANTWVEKPLRKRMNILRERFADENNQQGWNRLRDENTLLPYLGLKKTCKIQKKFQ